MGKWQSLKDILLQQKVIFWLYIVVAALASIHLVSLGAHHEFEGHVYTEYNNYIIFKNSFYHLLSSKDLYILYPDEQWDLYKYSPAFALFMGLIAWLPNVIGLIVWNVLNALVLFWAIKMLPFRQRTISLLLWFVFLEMLTSIQSSQSNAMLAGLIIAAYGWMQRGKVAWATLMLVLATFIKVYGAVGFCLFLFYPDKVKFILYSILWTLILAFIPVIVISPSILMDQYVSWARMMAEDQAISYGYSLMGLLHAWFRLDNIKNQVMLIGVILFFVPLLRYKLYKNNIYRILILAHVLIWVVIFNHKAESPTFIIAVAGIGLWYFANNRTKWRDGLLICAFIFTCLSPTDVFPPAFRQHVLVPFVVKVIPCVLIWVIIMAQLFSIKKDQAIANTAEG